MNKKHIWLGIAAFVAAVIKFAFPYKVTDIAAHMWVNPNGHYFIFTHTAEGAPSLPGGFHQLEILWSRSLLECVVVFILTFILGMVVWKKTPQTAEQVAGGSRGDQ